MSTVNQAYGTYTSMTVTNLHSLASSATAGWQSARVSNVSTKALDYAISVKIAAVNTAAANDKAVYVYASTATSSDGGTTWFHDDAGANVPSGSEGTLTISSPNNLKLLGILNYTTTNTVLQGTFLLSNAFGQFMPEGFSIVIINFTGFTTAASGNVVAYEAITETNQ